MKTPPVFIVPLLATLLVAGLMAGCTSGNGSIAVGERFSLAPGEEAHLKAADGRILTVRFEGVIADSRCPVDVVCIQAGDARVALVIEGDTRQPVTLTFPTEPSVEFEGFDVEVTGVDPAPRSGQPINPEDYRVTLVAEET